MSIKTAKAPDAPINLAIDENVSTSSVIKLTWQKGASDGATPVEDYVVYYDDGTTGDW